MRFGHKSKPVKTDHNMLIWQDSNEANFSSWHSHISLMQTAPKLENHVDPRVTHCALICKIIASQSTTR